MHTSLSQHWLSRILVTLAIVALASAGCDDDGGDGERTDTAMADTAMTDTIATTDTTTTDTTTTDTATTDTSTADDGFVRAAHLSPDAGDVDLYLQGVASPLVEEFTFGTTTGYLPVAPGDYTFEVAPTGTSIDDSVLSIAASVDPNTRYTVAAIGTVDGSTLTSTAMIDDLDVPNDMIRVRAIHAAAAVGQVDIWNIPDDGDPAPLYEDVDFGVAGAEMDLPAGAYTLGLDTDDDATPELIFELPDLAAGTHADVFAVSDDTGVYLWALLDDDTTARIDPLQADVSVLHLSPDAGAVDVHVNEEADPSVEALAFENSAGPLSVAPGSYTFDITTAGSGLPGVLTAGPVDVVSTGDYLAVAIGRVADTLDALWLTIDDSAPSAGSGRVRAIHAAADVGEVDIWDVGGNTPTLLFENVGFGAVSDPLEVPAGNVTLALDVDDDQTPDVTFGEISVTDGLVADIFASNEDDGTAFLLVRPVDGTLARVDTQ